MVENGLEAARKRLEAARARERASTMTDRASIASLLEHAERCEHDADLLERQTAELQDTVDRSRRLAGEIGPSADEARAELEKIDLEAPVKPEPSPVTSDRPGTSDRSVVATAAYRCLDCGQVTRRTAKAAYECPLCGSFDCEAAEGDRGESH